MADSQRAKNDSTQDSKAGQIAFNGILEFLGKLGSLPDEVSKLSERLSRVEKALQGTASKGNKESLTTMPSDKEISPESQHNHSGISKTTPAASQQCPTTTQQAVLPSNKSTDADKDKNVNASTPIDQIEETRIPGDWKKVRRTLAEVEGLFRENYTLSQSRLDHIEKARKAALAIRKDWAIKEKKHCEPSPDVSQEVRRDEAIRAYVNCVVLVLENVWLADLEDNTFRRDDHFRTEREILSELIGIDTDKEGPYLTIRKALLELALRIEKAEGKLKDFVRQEPTISDRIAEFRKKWATAEMEQSKYPQMTPREFNQVRDELLLDLIVRFFDVVREWGDKQRNQVLDRFWDEHERSLGLERFVPVFGEPFNDLQHQSDMATSGGQNSKIDKCAQAGYRYVGDKQVLRKAKVSLMKPETKRQW